MNMSLKETTPQEFTFPKDFFDTKEMRRLFKRGYDDAINGYKWHKTPPGYAAEDETPEKTE